MASKDDWTEHQTPESKFRVADGEVAYYTALMPSSSSLRAVATRFAETADYGDDCDEEPVVCSVENITTGASAYFAVRNGGRIEFPSALRGGARGY